MVPAQAHVRSQAEALRAPSEDSQEEDCIDGGNASNRPRTADVVHMQLEEIEGSAAKRQPVNGSTVPQLLEAGSGTQLPGAAEAMTHPALHDPRPAALGTQSGQDAAKGAQNEARNPAMQKVFGRQRGHMDTFASPRAQVQDDERRTCSPFALETESSDDAAMSDIATTHVDGGLATLGDPGSEPLAEEPKKARGKTPAAKRPGRKPLKKGSTPQPDQKRMPKGKGKSKRPAQNRKATAANNRQQLEAAECKAGGLDQKERTAGGHYNVATYQKGRADTGKVSEDVPDWLSKIPEQVSSYSCIYTKYKGECVHTIENSLHISWYIHTTYNILRNLLREPALEIE